MNHDLFFISAGEASGDLHGATLINELQKVNPKLKFIGIGGQRMQAAGCDLVVDNKKLAVVGIWEIIKHLGPILSAAKLIKKILKQRQPATIILIDYPGFNLRLAKFAKKLGIRVVYYIPPQLWAWHESRIRIIKKYVDCVLVIYPFEVEFYRKHHVKAYYVGNFLVKQTVTTLDRQSFCALFQLDPSRPLIGLAPGSRLGEIERMFETLLQSAKRLQQKHRAIQLLIPLAPSLQKTDLEVLLKQYQHLNIQIITHHLTDLFHICDVMIAVSGTVTVEIALARTPCVVIYKVNPLTYYLGKKLIKVPYISLVNLILNREVLPELIQNEASPERIAEIAESLLVDMNTYGKILEGLIEFRQHFENQPAYAIADVILKTNPELLEISMTKMNYLR